MVEGPEGERGCLYEFWDVEVDADVVHAGVKHVIPTCYDVGVGELDEALHLDVGDVCRWVCASVEEVN